MSVMRHEDLSKIIEYYISLFFNMKESHPKLLY